MSKNIQNILVSQPEPTNPKSPYFSIAKTYGVTFDFKPFFRTEPVSAREFRDQKIDLLDHTAVVLTSRTSADHFFRMAGEMRLTMPDSMKYFCSSETVATYLQKYIVYRKRKVFFPTNGQSSELTNIILKHPKETYFIPVTEGHKETLLHTLEEKHIKYSKSVLYRTVHQDFSPKEIESYDMIVFFSPNGISSLFKNVPEYTQGEQLLACFGEGTAKALEAANLKASVSAPSPEFPSMTSAIESFLEQNKK